MLCGIRNDKQGCAGDSAVGQTMDTPSSPTRDRTCLLRDFAWNTHRQIVNTNKQGSLRLNLYPNLGRWGSSARSSDQSMPAVVNLVTLIRSAAWQAAVIGQNRAASQG